MIAEFSIYPTDETHMSKDIAKVVEILDDTELTYRLGPMSTSVEGDWEEIMSAIRRCHQAVSGTHRRLITTITIDDRRDQPHHLDEMVAAVRQHLGRSPKTIEPPKS
jgi:uncharacterized protein (TIGR00106 family)